MMQNNSLVAFLDFTFFLSFPISRSIFLGHSYFVSRNTELFNGGKLTLQTLM